VACRINRRLAPLSETLQSGQTVEIITAPGAHPNPSWFNYAVSAKARTNIRHFLKHQTAEDSIALGKRLLDKALSSFGTQLSELPSEQLQEYLQRQNYSQLEQLATAIARGDRVPEIAAQQLLGEISSDPHSQSDTSQQALAIRGTEGFMVNFAKCCHPIPGDPLAGYLSPEKGMVVHREVCNNLNDMRDQQERLIALRWDNEVEGTYSVELRVEVENHRGMIAVLATRMSSMDINIEKISTEDKDYQFSYVDIEIQVTNRVHLAKVLRRLRSLAWVSKVTRIKN
jgi:(p)ppGpp synthase/HD superfamily hydrolase